MKNAFLLLVLAVTVSAAAQTTEKRRTPSPPEVYQAFLIALVKGDEALLERLALPNKELPLLTSTPVPVEYREQAVAQIKAASYRVLSAGEVFRLPDGKTVSPTAEMEKKGCVMIASDADPLPHFLRISGGEWKVDAGDLIAAHKAVAARNK